MAVVWGVSWQVLAGMRRRGREAAKKIAEKTYEVFFRVSRAFGARDGNVWGALRFTKVC